jgi:hypothetical protein
LKLWTSNIAARRFPDRLGIKFESACFTNRDGQTRDQRLMQQFPDVRVSLKRPS